MAESKLWAFLAVFLSIIGFLLVFLTQKKDRYAMFYAKQSLIIFIAWFIAAIVGIVPIIGWIVSPILMLIIFILWVIALINSMSGKTKNTPLIGKYAEKFKM